MGTPAKKTSTAATNVETMERPKPREEDAETQETPEAGVEAPEGGKEAERTPEEVEADELANKEAEVAKDTERAEKLESAEFDPESTAQRQAVDSLKGLRDSVEVGTRAGEALKELSAKIEGVQKEMGDIQVESKILGQRMAEEGVTEESSKMMNLFAEKMQQLEKKVEELFEQGELAIAEVAQEAQKEDSNTSMDAVAIPSRLLQAALKDLSESVGGVSKKWGETAGKAHEVLEGKQEQDEQVSDEGEAEPEPLEEDGAVDDAELTATNEAPPVVESTPEAA